MSKFMDDSLLLLNCRLQLGESLLANPYVLHQLLLLGGHVPHHLQELCIRTPPPPESAGARAPTSSEFGVGAAAKLEEGPKMLGGPAG